MPIVRAETAELLGLAPRVHRPGPYWPFAAAGVPVSSVFADLLNPV
jgi:hypothetical protein